MFRTGQVDHPVTLSIVRLVLHPESRSSDSDSVSFCLLSLALISRTPKLKFEHPKFKLRTLPVSPEVAAQGKAAQRPRPCSDLRLLPSTLPVAAGKLQTRTFKLSEGVMLSLGSPKLPVCPTAVIRVPALRLTNISSRRSIHHPSRRLGQWGLDGGLRSYRALEWRTGKAPPSLFGPSSSVYLSISQALSSQVLRVLPVTRIGGPDIRKHAKSG